MQYRFFLLATTTCFFVHAAAAQDPVHIGFDGYRSSSNDYCISAESIHGDPIFGYLWRFSAGGGPSEPTRAPTSVNLLRSSSIELFPRSIADRERFRVYGTPLGPIVGDKSISNELNATRSQICTTDDDGGDDDGGGDDGDGGDDDGGGDDGDGGDDGGGDDGNGGDDGDGGDDGGIDGGGADGRGGRAVDNPNVHRQMARLLGTDFATSADLIPDAIRCGFGMQPSLASDTSFSAGPRWCAWAAPQQVKYSDDRNGLRFTGTLRNLRFGQTFRFSRDLVAGLAFTPEDTEATLAGPDVSIRQDGFGGGPYLGWRIRPTTIFDVWAGYVRLDRSFDIFGFSATAPVDRTFISTGLTEIIDTPWMRVMPRARYYYGRDKVQSFTASGFTLLDATYDYSFVEGSVELSRDVLFANGLLLQPFVHATARYDIEPIVDTITTIDGMDVTPERWTGQLRGGVRAQVGPQIQLSLSGGYLSVDTQGVDAWDLRGHLSFRF